MKNEKPLMIGFNFHDKRMEQHKPLVLKAQAQSERPDFLKLRSTSRYVDNISLSRPFSFVPRSSEFNS